MILHAARKRARRPWALLVVGALVLAATATWAFRRLPSPIVAAPVLAVEEPADPTRLPRQVAVLDTRAFDTPLWVAPPAPPAPPAPVPPPPPPPPLRLQLIAVLTEASGSPPGTIQTGLFYDPDADKLVSFRVGDRLAGRAIEQIDDHGVTIREQTGPRRLALRDDVAGLPPVLMAPPTPLPRSGPNSASNPPVLGASP